MNLLNKCTKGEIELIEKAGVTHSWIRIIPKKN